MSEMMSDLFVPEPEQWSRSADPGVWKALRSRLAATVIPPRSEAVRRLLTDAFQTTLGVDVTCGPLPEESWQAYLEQFGHGGMSSGVVDVAEWQHRFIPLLVSRASRPHGNEGARR